MINFAKLIVERWSCTSKHSLIYFRMKLNCPFLVAYCVFLVAYCVFLVAYCVFVVAYCVFSNVYFHICKSPKFTQISISLHRPRLATIQTSFRCHDPVVHLYDLLIVNCFCHKYSRNTAHLKLENNQSINKDKIS